MIHSYFSSQSPPPFFDHSIKLASLHINAPNGSQTVKNKHFFWKYTVYSQSCFETPSGICNRGDGNLLATLLIVTEMLRLIQYKEEERKRQTQVL